VAESSHEESVGQLKQQLVEDLIAEKQAYIEKMSL
jgi:hypothetical protein